MKTYTSEELKPILDSHRKWLNSAEGGSRADLSSAVLRGADLSSADLRGADLSSAVLSGAVLSSADLRSADLSSADLRGAVLSSAVLSSADLSSAVLRSADLSSADLSSADLRSAVLRSADLSSAVLRCADLSSADLRSADLRGADLRSADLRSADLSSAVLRGAVLSSADLRGAVLSSAKGLPESVQGLRKLVAETILESPSNRLNMSTWHTCDTTHCIAGWAVHLAPQGRYLEQQLSTPTAARALLGLLEKGEDELFYKSNEEVMDTLREWAGVPKSEEVATE